MGLTKHARKRLQQRAIPAFMLNYLDTFGSFKRCGGSGRMFFDKAAQRRLANHHGGEASLKPLER